VVAFLNELQLVSGTTARAYTLPLDKRRDTDAPNQVTIKFKRVIAGTYLVRIQVDGAASSLVSDASGRFVSPTVVVPIP